VCTGSGLRYLLRHINSQVKHDGGVFEVLTTAKCSLGEMSEMVIPSFAKDLASFHREL
jgi:hypothetical protein